MIEEKVMERLDKQDAILEQLIDMVAKNNQAVQEIRSDMAEMKSDMAEMKSDMTGMKSEMAGMKSDIAEMKSDISILKTDIAEVKTNLKEVNGKVTQLQKADEERGYQVEVLNKRLFKTEVAVERTS